MPILLVLAVIVTWFSISFGLSAWGFERDYRLRVPNWSNIVELQSRGNKFLLGFFNVYFIYPFNPLYSGIFPNYSLPSRKYWVYDRCCSFCYSEWTRNILW